jgi:hypothetical protein
MSEQEPAGPPRPASLAWAQRALAGLSVLGVLATVLVVVRRDSLVRSWAEGRSDMRRVLQTQGLQAIKDGPVHPPAFVPVAVVLCVVVVSLIWVVTAFLRGGFGWARIVLSVLVFFLAVGTIAGLRTGQPVVFEVLSVVSFPLEAVVLVALWHRDTGAFLRGDDVRRAEPAER